MKENERVFAKVKCEKGNIEFTLGWKSLKNNENLCSHCPIRGKCTNRLNEHVHPYEMLRGSMLTPKYITVG